MPPLLTIRLITVAALFAATFHDPLVAQTHRVDAPQPVTRSVGVYEWTGDLAKPTAARLVPVSLFIEGAYQDGGTYYARPIPLALLNGNIYSLEKAGVAEGTVTLDYARHLQTTALDNATDSATDLGWFGYGTFAALPAPRKVSALHASANIATIVSSKDDSSKDNDRPTFANKKSDDTKTSASSKKSEPSASVTPIASDDDPDRPRLSKVPSTTAGTPDPASPPTTTQTPTDSRTTTTTKDADDDNDRPTLRHRDPKQAAADRKVRSQSSVSSTPGSLNDDPDRPNMRRGRSEGIGGAPSPQLKGIPADLHQIVAVSDPTNREQHPFAREWATPTERAEVLAKLEAVARQQLAAYARNNGVEQPSTAPATPRPAPKTAARPASAARRAAAPRPPAVAAAPLASEELTPFILSYGGLPTFVYTASNPPPAGRLTLPERYITLVAQQLPSGELQLAFATVTDAAHLNRTPWFRLVDAVDPDAEHRASLLFELRGQSSRQFALYRILSAKAEPLFATASIQ